MGAAPNQTTSAGPALLCRVGGRVCAIPLAEVVETLRPLPIEPMGGAPAFVLGAAVIRGRALPVVDAAQLLGEPGGAPTRFVTVRAGDREVALAVDAVLGVGALTAAEVAQLPPLLGDAGGVVAALASRDAALLVVLRGARVVAGAIDGAP